MIWRVVYMGTAEIACPPLRVLAGMPEIELAAVYTQPDRPRGRGQSVRFSPVKKLALDKGVPVLQPGIPRRRSVQSKNYPHSSQMFWW